MERLLPFSNLTNYLLFIAVGICLLWCTKCSEKISHVTLYVNFSFSMYAFQNYLYISN